MQMAEVSQPNDGLEILIMAGDNPGLSYAH